MKKKNITHTIDSLFVFFSQIIDNMPVEYRLAEYITPAMLRIITILSFQNKVKIEDVITELSKQWEIEREYLKTKPNTLN